MESVAFIDDKSYPVDPGETILNFVRRHLGKELIPTLCDAPNLDPFGSCRVCSVDEHWQKMGPQKHKRLATRRLFLTLTSIQITKRSNAYVRISLNWYLLIIL